VENKVTGKTFCRLGATMEDKFETCVRSSGFKCNWTSFFQDSQSCGDFFLFPELCLRSAIHNSTHFTSIRPSGKEDW